MRMFTHRSTRGSSHCSRATVAAVSGWSTWAQWSRWGSTTASPATSAIAVEADERIARLRSHPNAKNIVARNFSFSGCGFLIPYHLGIADALKTLGYIQPAHSRVAGASGGSIVALAIAANADLRQLQEDAKHMTTFAPPRGSWGTLEPELRRMFFERFANINVEELASRLTITTHQVWPKQAIVHFDSFHSPEDLCDALIASCFIPFYLSRQATSIFRGEFHVDGGLIRIVPEVADHVRVCAFHAKALRREDYEISPSLDPAFPYNVLELFRFSLFPPKPAVLDDLFHHGRLTAVLWAEKQLNAQGRK